MEWNGMGGDIALSDRLYISLYLCYLTYSGTRRDIY